ncbi:hypothetical protein PHLGIDRAFT_414598 [Phlebiopsis gigantea 11061_1 CR5-6]|uniref:Uncharacterized protein n=1 Tax=Phlebiopsis gigantea (strain 11061_1 CR5-6) TaxID=745531 RepID=A0A0C3NQU4_PHLG1|nr:hypothetical protein PHLGIDRAFT_414598 [Phlebiopsis gigantea 11061_1 CR5-6]
MDTLDLDPGLAQDFVKLLNAKLKETKAALDKATTVRLIFIPAHLHVQHPQENAKLQESVRRYEAQGAGVEDVQQEDLYRTSLTKELEDAQALLNEYVRKMKECTDENILLRAAYEKLRDEVKRREDASEIEDLLGCREFDSPSSATSSTIASETNEHIPGGHVPVNIEYSYMQNVDDFRDKQQIPCIARGRSPTTLHNFKDIKKLSVEKSSVMYWPGRTVFPYGGGTNTDARINACLFKCDTTTNPFTWSPSNHKLARLVGSLQELFYHSDEGTCYLGTYRCTSTGVYTADEIAQFSASMKDDVVQQSFHKPTQYRKASASDKNIVLSAYLDGGSKTAKLEFLHLKFELFDHEYFEALMKLKEEDDRAREGKQQKRKRAEEAERENALRAKRARLFSLL